MNTMLYGGLPVAAEPAAGLCGVCAIAYSGRTRNRPKPAKNCAHLVRNLPLVFPSIFALLPVVSRGTLPAVRVPILRPLVKSLQHRSRGRRGGAVPESGTSTTY